MTLESDGQFRMIANLLRCSSRRGSVWWLPLLAAASHHNGPPSQRVPSDYHPAYFLGDDNYPFEKVVTDDAYWFEAIVDDGWDAFSSLQHCSKRLLAVLPGSHRRANDKNVERILFPLALVA